MTTSPIRLSPSGPVITNENGAPLTFGPGARVRLTELCSTMTGTTDVPQCPEVISANGFGDSTALTLTLDAPNEKFRYRANLSLDLVSSATAAGGIVVLYLDTSVDNGQTFTNRVANSHQIGTGINSIDPGHPAEGRQIEIWMPLTGGSSLGVDNSSPPASLQIRAQAQLVYGASGTVKVFSNASEPATAAVTAGTTANAKGKEGKAAQPQPLECSQQVSGLNGTIHMELEECF